MVNLINRKKLVIFCVSILAVIVLLWSCSKEDVTPIVLVPTIASVTPTSGEIGDEVTITGTNFNTAAVYNEILFNGMVNTASFSTGSSITTTIPAGSPPGAGEVVVKAYGVTTEGLSFTVIWPPPVLTKIDKNYEAIGDTITISGENFSDNNEDNTVSIGGTAATVVESTNTSIRAVIASGTASGENVVALTVFGAASNSGSYYVAINPATVEYLLDDTTNDVEESVTRGDGKVEDGSSDLELGMFDTGYTPDFGKSIVGIRHHDIAVPQGATILSAYLQFVADDDGSDPCQVTIYGEDSGDAAIFDETIAYNVSTRTLTTGSVVWDIPTWVDLDRGDAQKTPDLKAIIQEIVNRVDWVSGNAMSFQLHDSGPTADPQLGDPEGREADCGDEFGPSLVIIYEQ